MTQGDIGFLKQYLYTFMYIV